MVCFRMNMDITAVKALMSSRVVWSVPLHAVTMPSTSSALMLGVSICRSSTASSARLRVPFLSSSLSSKIRLTVSRWVWLNGAMTASWPTIMNWSRVSADRLSPCSSVLKTPAYMRASPTLSHRMVPSPDFPTRQYVSKAITRSMRTVGGIPGKYVSSPAAGGLKRPRQPSAPAVSMAQSCAVSSSGRYVLKPGTASTERQGSRSEDWTLTCLSQAFSICSQAEPPWRCSVSPWRRMSALLLSLSCCFMTAFRISDIMRGRSVAILHHCS
mmetsp:Transcript_98631/g.279352  ORF Transcript_98631/g.279352 Transcript_98631/m.279352 type:complete len:270 (+) Transcript_98631:1153-1962(+)